MGNPDKRKRRAKAKAKANRARRYGSVAMDDEEIITLDDDIIELFNALPSPDKGEEVIAQIIPFVVEKQGRDDDFLFLAPAYYAAMYYFWSQDLPIIRSEVSELSVALFYEFDYREALASSASDSPEIANLNCS